MIIHTTKNISSIMALVTIIITLLLFSAGSISARRKHSDRHDRIVTEVELDFGPDDHSIDDDHDGVICNCETQPCPDILPDQCPHGLVPDTRDPCSCCHVCGNGVDEYCDPDDETFDEFERNFAPSTSSKKSITASTIKMRWDPRENYFGRCGDHMRCLPNIDLPRKTADARNLSPLVFLKAVETVCFCVDQEMVCGSDGVTYDNPCQLKKAAAKAAAKSGRNIVEWKRGMCPGVPEIVTAPLEVVTRMGERALLHCELASQPLPSVEWHRNGVALSGGTIPGDNARYLVTQHGGPEPNMVTTWLDIGNITGSDAGVYECRGRNMYGVVVASASITVTPSLSLSSY